MSDTLKETATFVQFFEDSVFGVCLQKRTLASVPQVNGCACDRSKVWRRAGV